MSVFGVFATVLTIMYVIYYAWMIGRDLYGKKDQQTSQQETFEVASNEVEEVITEVVERGDGFRFSTDPEEEEEEKLEPLETPEKEENEEADVPTQADHAILTMYNAGMEEIKPEHSKVLESNEFINALMNRETIPGNLLKVTRNEL